MMFIELGYDHHTPDGIFDVGTGAALRAFQRDEKIKPDGVFGWQSLELMQMRLTRERSLQLNPPKEPLDKTEILPEYGYP